MGFSRAMPSIYSNPLCLLLSSLSHSQTPLLRPTIWCRAASGSTRWKMRQKGDPYAREAKVQGLKSRAAFKLLEMDSKYRLFRPGQTVIDLGYAPGSWSQVALSKTKPRGRVIGIDLIPAQPPRGVATFQGDFLSPSVQKMVKNFIVESHRQRPRVQDSAETPDSQEPTEESEALDQPSYIDMERQETHTEEVSAAEQVVLSDMSEPWVQTSFGSSSLSNMYNRLMNTSGHAFRDHAGSMDLCNAALQFASDTLRPGGHFVCKFYQGAEDKKLELKLKKLFGKVHREKPDASRSESKEAYLIGLRRKEGVFIEES
ncbi:FtsJ-like methyltransferase-domain-containing protein [Stachybotrys elegans]|uniref:rRNA methyltransferase 2, mitochondrial n=1 Tax=Stachybotrys elegans TaxID=80388 RepID=A0A8K0WTP3_9HYPO|nr:FtsJ-like methyltransferase-domain-containing protein [Stachybotrys elegans]